MDKLNIFKKENHIYKITSDIDLGSEQLIIPKNCTLDFQGGTISGGSIVFDSTKILPNGCVITDYISSEISGTYAIGQCLFNIENKIPVWWNGITWINAGGIEV